MKAGNFSASTVRLTARVNCSRKSVGEIHENYSQQVAQSRTKGLMVEAMTTKRFLGGARDECAVEGVVLRVLAKIESNLVLIHHTRHHL